MREIKISVNVTYDAGNSVSRSFRSVDKMLEWVSAEQKKEDEDAPKRAAKKAKETAGGPSVVPNLKGSK